MGTSLGISSELESPANKVSQPAGAMLLRWALMIVRLYHKERHQGCWADDRVGCMAQCMVGAALKLKTELPVGSDLGTGADSEEPFTLTEGFGS